MATLVLVAHACEILTRAGSMQRDLKAVQEEVVDRPLVVVGVLSSCVNGGCQLAILKGLHDPAEAFSVLQLGIHLSVDVERELLDPAVVFILRHRVSIWVIGVSIVVLVAYIGVIVRVVVCRKHHRITSTGD